jgi:hypothetical protein
MEHFGEHHLEVAGSHGRRRRGWARGAQIHLSPPGEPGKWGRNSLTGIDGSSRRTTWSSIRSARARANTNLGSRPMRGDKHDRG